MQAKDIKDIKEFKAQLKIFYTGLPHSVEKLILQKVIEETNSDKQVDAKSLLVMVYQKIEKEKKKQTSQRDKSLLIWANIMKLLIAHLKGSNVEGKHFHHGHINTYEEGKNTMEFSTTPEAPQSFAMAEVQEEEGMA